MPLGEKIVEHRNQRSSVSQISVKLISSGYSMLTINALGLISSREFSILGLKVSPHTACFIRKLNFK